MKQIPIDSILVPDNRIRESTTDTPISSLAESLQTFGQLCPILVAPLPDGQFRLIAGERRLLAAISLGWPTIGAVQRDTASEPEMRCLEIVENIHREQFSWPEEVRAKSELHELMMNTMGIEVPEGMRVHNNWTLEHTAALLGESKATLSRDITLCERLVELPSLADKPTKSAALDYSRRHKDFAVREILAVELIERQRVEQSEAMRPTRYALYNGDCIGVMKDTINDESIDLVLTDPPFGLRMGEDSVGSWASWRGLIYSDEKNEYKPLMQGFLREAFRVLKEGRHCYVMCGWEWCDALRGWAEEAGFIVPGAPGIWVKLGGKWRQHMDRLSTNYYNILFMAKPYAEAQTHRWQELDGYVDAAFSMVRVHGHRRHPAEAPVDLFQKFIRVSSRKHETVLDPFCGSGSSGVAALHEWRQYIGIDLDSKWIDLTRLRCEEVQTIGQQPVGGSDGV